MHSSHTMLRVTDPEASARFFELLQPGEHKAPAEPWTSLPNVGEW